MSAAPPPDTLPDALVVVDGDRVLSVGPYASTRVPKGAETIDLTTVAFGSSTTLGYTGNTLSGTLTVTDGSNTARLVMLGNYIAANFHLADDGNGGVGCSIPS